MPPFAIPPPPLLAALSVTVVRTRVSVPLVPDSAPRRRDYIPPRSVSRWRVRVPAAATSRMRNPGALASRSMLVVSAPRPVMVRGLVITGQAISAPGGIVRRRQGIGPRGQPDGIGFAVRIRGIDGVDQTRDVSGAAPKGLRLD